MTNLAFQPVREPLRLVPLLGGSSILFCSEVDAIEQPGHALNTEAKSDDASSGFSKLLLMFLMVLAFS